MSNSAYEGGSVPPEDDEEDWDAANADAGTGTGTEENSDAESYETEDELNDEACARLAMPTVRLFEPACAVIWTGALMEWVRWSTFSEAHYTAVSV